MAAPAVVAAAVVVPVSEPVASVDVIVPGMADLPARPVQRAGQVPAFVAGKMPIGGEAALHFRDMSLLPAQLADLTAVEVAGAPALVDAVLLAPLPCIDRVAVSPVVSAMIPPAPVGGPVRGTMVAAAGPCIAGLASSVVGPPVAVLLDPGAVALHARPVAVAARLGGARESERGQLSLIHI